MTHANIMKCEPCDDARFHGREWCERHGPRKGAKEEGKCSIARCGRESRTYHGGQGPYCYEHERSEEWAFCFDCDAFCQPATEDSDIELCSLHGGADYVPHTTEEPDTEPTEPLPSTTQEAREESRTHAPGQHDGRVSTDSHEGSNIAQEQPPCPRCGPVRALCEFPPTCFRAALPDSKFCEIHKCITPGCGSKRERSFHHCEKHPAE